ncbi:acyl-ACP--UDP-N-acetylglucosamine O-acyltransferase [Synergistes jonesii]|uniref:acyl-ACP--UDP-N-acetylglucosamine O-acyltransferase n=1 Tax=Synergistes jonesii TaxID=2754 RepID=UPI003323F035
MSVQIHPTAIVEKGAELGEDVTIGAYCIVDAKTKIGDGTVLRPFASVCEYTELGENCTIYEHAVIGGVPQDLSFRGEETRVKIGKGVVCREFVTINRAVGEGGATTVGDGCLIMEGVHFAHNVTVGRECTIANKTGLSGHVWIGDYVVIGGMSGFHQFTRVGSYCMIGGMSRVTQDVPPYALAAGIPLRVYDINRVGLKRRGFDMKTRSKIREMYRIIYNLGLTNREGLARIGELYPEDAEAKMILDFAEASKRGLTPRMTQDWTHGSEEKVD